MKINSSDPRYQQLVRRLSWDDIDVAYVEQLIAIANKEDIEAAGLKFIPRIPCDVTTSLLESKQDVKAALVTRAPMHLCGIELVPLILNSYSKTGYEVCFSTKLQDGARLVAGDVLGVLQGSVHTILTAERVILNFLQHLSGIASQTARYIEALGKSSTKLLDTRKTTPGFRVLEKYAVACGGGWNHRMGLYDRIMLKDNHLAMSMRSGETNSLRDWVNLSRKKYPELLIEIEIDQLDQLSTALSTEADIILLDNFGLEDLKRAVEQIGERAYSEASGGVSLLSLPYLGNIGLDFISCGALVHQSQWVDIGLDWL